MARESLRLRATQSVSARTIVAIAAVVAGLCFAVAVPAWRVVCWAAPVIVLAQLNAWVSARALRDLDSASADSLAERQAWLWVTTMLNQAALGLTVWWMGTGSGDAIAMMATALQLIYIGGALINASTHPPTLIAGAWLNLAAAALFWLTREGTSGLALVFPLLGMGLVVAASCRQTAATFRDSLQMRFENADLLQRLAREKLAAEQANAAKSRFLAAASHDLRQPLHALMVFASLLGRHETPQTAQLLAHIRDAAGSLDKLFSGLLDISKLETGSIVPQMQAVQITAMAEELVREFSPQCTARGVDIAVRGPAAWVLSDPFLLERVLRNLIDNAVKYTPAGHIRVEVSLDADAVQVEVQDTGIAIAPELQDRVFEEYFQVDNPARSPAKGVGLGLAIVRRLVHLLEIRLSLQSRLGEGTTFRLHLPMAPLLDAAGAGTDAKTADVALRPGLRIWLIEDHDAVRLATAQLLLSWGCEVTSWEGRPAENAFAVNAPVPQAMIVDYRLSDGVSGLDVVAVVRSRWPGLPAAIITGDPDIDRAEVARLGVLTVMQKPVHPAVLAQWLDGAVVAPAQPVPVQAMLTPSRAHT